MAGADTGMAEHPGLSNRMLDDAARPRLDEDSPFAGRGGEGRPGRCAETLRVTLVRRLLRHPQLPGDL